jgi:lipid II:glycine glycyltransferase (peptidoglycan interpeptide bridge formation enzyme)
LTANSFASEPFQLPKLSREHARSERCEYTLDLHGDLLAAASSHHRRNIRKALGKGCRLSKSADLAALASHRQLMTQSFSRRSLRGESVPTDFIMDEHGAYLSTGAGLLYQIQHEGGVVASTLILRAKNAAYFHSSGNHPEGMRIGASHLLMHLLSLDLQAEGVACLMLGGAQPDSGLADFKLGFGARPIKLSMARYELGSAWRRHLGKLARSLSNRLARS